MADSTITGLTAVTAVEAADVFLLKQAASARARRASMLQVSNYLQTGFRPMVDVTGLTKTLALSDAGTLQVCSNASAQELIIPPNSSVAFDEGVEIEVLNWGAGQVSFAAGSGVTIQPSTTLKISAQYKTAVAKQITTDTWVLIGALTS